MAELRTEEEQVDAIKQWWKENGRSTLVGVAIAVVVVFGWRGWQDHQRQTSETASAIYQGLLTASAVQPSAALSEEKRKTATHLAGQLKTDFGDSLYAKYAALWLAKSAAETDQLDLAKTELEWVLAQNPEPGLAQITRLRLARVLFAQGQAEQALGQLQSGAVEGFQASFYEIQGDIYRGMGRDDEARDAYKKAVAASQDAPRPLLTMKLDDLTVVGE